MGSPDGDGTLDDPVHIQAGLDLAAASDLDFVVVSFGTYDEGIELAEGITLYGGYDLTFTDRRPDVRNDHRWPRGRPSGDRTRHR